jgi:hypothetical protein
MEFSFLILYNEEPGDICRLGSAHRLVTPGRSYGCTHRSDVRDK